MTIRCEIVSQDRIVYQDEVDIVVLPGIEGVMGILPNHAPVLSVLQFGVITVRKQNEEHFFTVAGGLAEVQPDQVTILADAAEDVDEINIERAEAAKRRAEEVLKEGVRMDTDEYLAVQAALRRSTLRLTAVQRYRMRRKSSYSE
jgi:F-type H+-transporting ATPase subunit epsilon